MSESAQIPRRVRMVQSVSHFTALLRDGSSAIFHLPPRTFSKALGEPSLHGLNQGLPTGLTLGTAAGGAGEKSEAGVRMSSASFSMAHCGLGHPLTKATARARQPLHTASRPRFWSPLPSSSVWGSPLHLPTGSSPAPSPA